MPKRLKIFLDTSALIAGLNSPIGAAGLILGGFATGQFAVFISSQVKEEAERVIKKKFPLLQTAWLNFLFSCPEIVKNPNNNEIKKSYRIIQTNDAPILAAAIKTNIDFFISWNTKHFLKTKVKNSVNFIICTPQEFKQKYWN